MPRQKRQRSSYVMPEPKWATYMSYKTPELQMEAYRACEQFVRTEIGDKQKITATKKWIKEKSGWDKKEIEIILKNPDWAFGPVSHAIWMEKKLGYIPINYIDYITNSKKPEWLERGSSIKEVQEEKEATKTPRKSIQDVMLEKLHLAGGEIDGLVDEYFQSKKKDERVTDKVLKILHQYNPLANHISNLVRGYDDEKAEFVELLSGQDEQLLEAYSHLTKPQVKNVITLYEQIISSLNSYATLKIKTRAKRARKPISPEKATSKIKYLKVFKDDATGLELESIRPVEMYMSKEVWAYDTARRKLHHYIADELGGELFVKGNTLLGFDKSKSQIKTLRKPKEQIKEVMGSKPQARKFFESIKAVGVVPKGRFNDNMIILRAF